MRFRLDVDGERREIDVERSAAGFAIRIDGAVYRVRTRSTAEFVDVRIGTKRFRVRLQGNEAILEDGVHRLRIEDVSEDRADVVEGRPTDTGAVVDVRSSMPGRVVRVAVAEGEIVTADRVVASIELRGSSAS